MMSIPITQRAALVRTCFSDDKRWQGLLRSAGAAPLPFFFNIEVIDGREFNAVPAAAIRSLIPEGYPHSFIFIADNHAMTEDGYPCLAMDLLDQPGRTFRTLAREMASIENNLSIANMGFEEFAEAADSNGVFRGF